MIRRLTLIVALILAAAAAGGPSALGGTPGPFSANPDPIDFKTIATSDSPTIHVTVRNDDPATVVTIASVDTSNGGGDLSASGCGGAAGVLNPNDTCDVSVTYSPNSNGTLDPGAGLDITDGDPLNPQQHFTIQGGAVAHRFMFASPPSPGFGTVAVGDISTAKQVTVHNQTDFGADPSADMTGPDASDFHLSGCGSSVGGGNDCTASVTFSPSGHGPESATLQVDGASFQFTGTAVDQVVVQPPLLPFGDQHVGSNSAAQPITVTNNGTQAISVGISGNPPDYNVDGADCAGQLAGGNSCTIQVVFSPNAIGQRNDTLTVEGQTVDLTGRGTAAVADASPASISFGNQPIFTKSAGRVVTVTNNGNDDMHIPAPTLGGTNADQFTISDTCQGSSPLPPTAQCTITVTFAPTLQMPADAVLQISSDANNGTQTVQLHGTGTRSAVVFAPGPVAFKRPHHAGTFSTPRTVTLTNRTSGPLVISKVRLTGPNPKSFRITGGNCAGRTIAADANCTETVRFAPNAVGVKAASLTVNDDGPNSPHSVALTGTATYPKDDAAVHGAVGCDAAKITWRRAGSSRRFDRTVLVRSRTHVPTGPNDGTRLPHGAGVLHDLGLRRFTAYEYRVFALYRSRTRPGTLNHSRGVVLRLRTGEICTPMDGGVISDTTPTASWLKHRTLFGYSFRLFHAGEQVQVKVSLHATSFTFSGRRHLRHGFTYTLFLYAYPPSRPEGTSIGRTTFRVR
jgi:Abnormal spindle-like microcephaly-assoc'd, ASPM-SPD-2-Hydin